MSGSNSYLTKSNSPSSEVDDFFKYKFSPGQPERFDETKPNFWLIIPFIFVGVGTPSPVSAGSAFHDSIKLKTPLSVSGSVGLLG